MNNLLKNKYSLLSYVFVIIIAFITIFYSIPRVILDSDYMWHIKVGEYIFNNGIVPKTNVFGYFNELKFFAHEWLFDYIIYFLYNLFGNNGVIGFVFINISIMSILINSLIFKRTNSHSFSIISTIFFIFLMADFSVARPQIFSYMLLTLTLYILVNNFDNLSKKVIYLIFIIIILVNSHAGSYPAFFAIFALYICCMFLQKVLDYDKGVSLDIENFSLREYLLFVYNKYLKSAILYIKKPFVILIALLPFVLINPYGLEIYLYPFKVMSDNYMLKYISEWAATPFVGLTKYYLLLLILLFICIKSSNRKNKMRDFLFILVFFIMSCSHVRHLSLSYITTFAFGLVYIYDFFTVTMKNIFVELTDGKLDISFNKNNFSKMIYLLVFIFVVYLYFTHSSSSYESKVKYEKSSYPTEIVNHIKNNDYDFDKNILFNEYDFGGYLINNDIKVFIDGRADVYSKSVNGVRDVFKEYIDIVYNFDNWENYFKENNIKYILLKKDKSFSKLLKISPKVNVIMEDDVGIFAEFIG